MKVGDLVKINPPEPYPQKVYEWDYQLGIITEVTAHNMRVYVASRKKEFLICKEHLTLVREGEQEEEL
tara:strand:- start:918 stop:1121 length:204 start_codon:yes stop_codon:yes gene_type:complete